MLGYSLKLRPYISYIGLIYGIGTSNKLVPVAWPLTSVSSAMESPIAAVLHEWHLQDLSAVDGGNGPAVAHVELRRLSSRMKPEKPRDLWMIQGDSVDSIHEIW